MRTIRISKTAKKDYESSYAWYLKQREEVAEQFSEEVSIALNTIQSNPERFARTGSVYRYYSLEVFPYRIIYRVKTAEIVIVAIAHHGRRPDYWRK